MRITNRLTEKQVRNAKPGKGNFLARLLDGGGLYLQATISKTGGVNRNWVFRYERNGKRRDMGLGSLHDVGLAAARQKAKELREQLVLEGIDPLEARNDERAKYRVMCAEKARAQTFRECVERYLSVHESKWKNRKHAQQWRSSLETYAYPVMGSLNVADIDEAHLVRVLQPIWKKIPETAGRVRGRIEAVLGYATVSKFRSGDNPARWRNHLQTLLGGTQKAVEHHAALPLVEAPTFMAELRERKSMSALALEFLILTAARTGEVIGARWSEIDLDARVWTIPKERMKAKAEHRVPLSLPAIEIFEGAAAARRVRIRHGRHRQAALQHGVARTAARHATRNYHARLPQHLPRLGGRADELSEPRRRHGARPYYPRQGRGRLPPRRSVREASAAHGAVGAVPREAAASGGRR